MDTDLGQKVVLVTGGGQGLGAAIVGELANAGANVFAADRSER
ncbi:MAG TPA: SDR family NAD(P)-dependent oxidoreductase, partial [Casimicrobiaceae bacterium]|nr:SDR family NAD(P)-dependent oxidoreductase [Casimicrobiaceae bacterium]